MINKVAVPVNDASQVIALDFCMALLVADVEDGIIIRNVTEDFREPLPSLRAHRLKDLQVNTVLCGAISDPLSMMLWHCSIEVAPGLAGDAAHVIEAYIHRRLQRFCMPDFRPGFRRRCGGHGRRHRGGRGGNPVRNA